MKESRMRINLRILAVVTCLALALFAAGSTKADLIIPKGQEVTIVFDKDASSKEFKTGDEIPIKLLTPIDIGGKIVVRDGAPGKAVVTDAKKNSGFGGKGYIEVQLVELTSGDAYLTPDGANIQLAAIGNEGKIRAEGKSKTVLAICTLIFSPLVKGSNGVIAANMPIKAEVAEDIVVVTND